jgi:uncharacterized membrane protein
MLWGLPIAAIVALAWVVLDSLASIVEGIIAYESGMPLTKEQIMAIIKQDITILCLNIPALANISWDVLEPIVSRMYDFIVGILVLFGVVTFNPTNQTYQATKVLDQKFASWAKKWIESRLARLGSTSEENKKALEGLVKQ